MANYSESRDMNNYGESLGNVFQALADPTRRAVIQRLGVGPASTKELAQPFGMALPSFMQHLGVLENSGLIASKKQGRVRTWQLDQERLIAVESWILEQRALWEERIDRFVNYVEDWYARETNLTENKYDFTVSRLIKAPRSVVWKAWTLPEHLEKWWCPKPMTTKIVGPGNRTRRTNCIHHGVDRRMATCPNVAADHGDYFYDERQRRHQVRNAGVGQERGGTSETSSDEL